jgi:hypothetical protein
VILLSSTGPVTGGVSETEETPGMLYMIDPSVWLL